MIAARLAASGAQGAVFDLVGADASSIPDKWQAVSTDVRDAGAVREAFARVADELGRPHVVVASAGVVPAWTSTAEIDVDDWERVFAVNARGVMLTVKEAVRVMGQGPGSIVAISSLNGWKGDPKIPSYVASKHAVVGLVRSVALDVGRRGIRVNAVGPGPVATEALLERMADRQASTGMSVDESLSAAASVTALGRIVTADEVATAVLFLASDLSSGITGHLLPVDGGVL